MGKDSKAGGPPFGLFPELYLALLGHPGKEVEYGEDRRLKHAPDTSQPGPGALKRIERWRPERTHEIGKDSDMISVWKHR